MGGLNDAQHRAVYATGPVLCCACPGSGKTTVVSHKVRHILESNRDANIIMTTFSRDAAEEMRQVLRRNARSLVRHGDFGEVGMRSARDGHHGVRRAVLDGVVQQVDDGLAQHRPVARNRNRAIGQVEIDAYAPLLGQHAEEAGRIPDELAQVDRFALCRRSPAFGAGEFE